MLRDEVLRWS